LRQATGTFSRRRPSTGHVEGAPYRAQDLVANRYLVKDIIGAGPLGFVFRAHDKEIDVEVALKVINPKLVQSPDERKNFAKVLRAARKLSHPNLVRVYEEGEDQDRPYFTSQFLDGLTLRKIIDLRLQKGGFFALHEIEPILAQVCAALDGAHKVGPHSDVKPDNVLVLPDLLKVTDFGLGLAMPRLPFVQAMKARKSDRYLAPELVDGSEIDLRADVYSVGVILGEMLSGLTPDGSIPELARRNPDVPVGVEGLYRKAINSNPVARFKTAADFIGELTEQVKKVAPQVAPVTPKVESATGTSAPPRTRTSTGMLQLQPRRESTKLPPPVDLPPPPPISGEHFIPDATQPVDPEMLAKALRASANGANGADLKQDRQETEVIDSGMFIASLDDDDAVQTNASVSTVPPPVSPVVGAAVGDPPPGQGAPSPFFAHEMRAEAGASKTWLLVIALVLLGIAVGGGGGYYLVQKQKASAQAQLEAQKEQDRLAAQRSAEQAAAEKAAEEKALEERLNAEKVAADQAAAEKANAKTPAEKAAAERKAAAEKAEADKAEADKLAAVAAEKAAAEKAAKDAAAAEKAAAEKAAKDTVTAEKLALEKAAKDKAALEKNTPDKAALAEKAAADKAAREKAAAERAEKAAAAAAEKAAADKAAKEKAVAAAAAAKGNAEPTCPEGMRPIAAGAFKMGTAPGDSMMSFDEKALSSVDVGAFCVDVFEYPNKKGATVMSGVGFADAKRMCETAGKRLCTEAEWEKACKGPNGAKWPYGAAFDANACNTENDDGDPRTLSFSGRFAKCRSAYGVSDLSGNVSEWTAEKIIKGGSYASSDYAVRCSARKSGGSKNSEVGFRCCSDSH
jgi:serine/threonine protein kinase